MTRKQAFDAGRRKYWTGKPCSKGHQSQRYVSSGICIQCISDHRKTYNKNAGDRQRDAAENPFYVSRPAHGQARYTYDHSPDDEAVVAAFINALNIARRVEYDAGVALSIAQTTARPVPRTGRWKARPPAAPRQIPEGM